MSQGLGGGRATVVALAVLVAACSGESDDPIVSLGSLPEDTAPLSTAPGTTGATTTVATTTTSTTVHTSSTPTTNPSAAPTGAAQAWEAFWTALPNPRSDGVLKGPATPEVKQSVAEFIYRPAFPRQLSAVESHPLVKGQGRFRAITDCLLTQPPLSGDANQSGLLVRGTAENRPNGWRVTKVDIGAKSPVCAPGELVEPAQELWVRDLELELGLPGSLPEIEALETEDLHSSTSEYADQIRAAGGTYRGERQLNPVVSAVTFDDAGRVVIQFRSCHTYSDDFGIVADGELLTDLYDPNVRRSDIGEVTRFGDGWRVSSIEGSRRPCEPGDGAIEVVGGG
ncbi:MAG: hypothetical protein GEU79_07480 [Acidimicrobiia bacterium]|nr:hypothetical protein [Acidimicrobiia bacterium]